MSSCPKCGAEQYGGNRAWVCGSRYWDGGDGRFIQHDACRIAELEAKLAEVTAHSTEVETRINEVVLAYHGMPLTLVDDAVVGGVAKLREELVKVTAERDEVRAENAQLRADAERWQRLKSLPPEWYMKHTHDGWYVAEDSEGGDYNIRGAGFCETPEQAIDAAREATDATE